MPNRKPYPTDVSDEEWAFVAPYLALIRQATPQRAHDLRGVFDALRWIVRAGAPWRMLPHDFPPWEASTSRPGGGSAPGPSRRWSTTRASFSGWPRAACPSPRPPCLTAARCAPPPKAVTARVTTGPSARRAQRSAPPSTPSGTCSPCASPPPPSKITRGWRSWRARCRRRRPRGWSCPRRPGLRGRRGGGRRRGARHPVAGGRAPRREGGLRLAAAQVGGRALVRVPVPQLSGRRPRGESVTASTAIFTVVDPLAGSRSARRSLARPRG